MHRALCRLLSAILVMLAALILLGAGLVLTGRNAVAVTHGISMIPVYHQGDLVVLDRSSTYQVGQIAA
jgi:signal peptidase I